MDFAESRIPEALTRQTGVGLAVRSAAALAIGAVFLGLLFTWARPERVASALGAARPAWLILALAAVIAAYAVRAGRWAAMLQAAGAPVRFRDTAVPVVGAAALDNLLPLGAGDAIRRIALQSFTGRPSARQIGTLALERRLDFAMALGVLLAGSAVRLQPPALLAAMLLAALAWAAMAAGGGAARGASWSAALGARLASLSLAALLAEAGVFAAAGAALGLGAVTLPIAGVAAGLAGLSRALPAPPGRLGVFDVCAAAAAALFGVAPAPAAAFALLSHALFWIPVTTVGWRLLLSADRIGVTRGPLVAA